MRGSFYVRYNKNRRRNFSYYHSLTVSRYRFRLTRPTLAPWRRLSRTNFLIRTRERKIALLTSDFKVVFTIKNTKGTQLIKNFHQSFRGIVQTKKKKTINLRIPFFQKNHRLRYGRVLQWKLKHYRNVASTKRTRKHRIKRVRKELAETFAAIAAKRYWGGYMREYERQLDFSDYCEFKVIEEIEYDEFMWRAAYDNPDISFQYADESYYTLDPDDDEFEDDLETEEDLADELSSDSSENDELDENDEEDCYYFGAGDDEDNEETYDYFFDCNSKSLLFKKLQNHFTLFAADSVLSVNDTARDFFIWFWEMYPHEKYYNGSVYWFSVTDFHPWVEYERFDDDDFAVLYWHIDCMDAESVETAIDIGYPSDWEAPEQETSVYTNLRSFATFIENSTQSDYFSSEETDFFSQGLEVNLKIFDREQWSNEQKKKETPLDAVPWLSNYVIYAKERDQELAKLQEEANNRRSRKKCKSLDEDDIDLWLFGSNKKPDGWSPARRAAHNRKKALELLTPNAPKKTWSLSRRAAYERRKNEKQDSENNV